MPKVFNQALKDIFKKLWWDKKGIDINGESLNYLTYPDDIVLITDKKGELQMMNQELNTET